MPKIVFNCRDYFYQTLDVALYITENYYYDLWRRKLVFNDVIPDDVTIRQQNGALCDVLAYSFNKIMLD